MEKRIPIGIVGLNFGHHIIESLQTRPECRDFEIVAVCDLDAAKAQKMAQKLGVRAFSNFEEFLSAPGIETVGLFTGPLGRAGLVRHLIEAGKDVITTKPFENDPQAAWDVLCEAEKLGRVVHLNSPAPLLPPDLAQIAAWRQQFGLGRAVACRADVWVSYREQADGSWYDEPEKCPVAPIFRLGIYLINDLVQIFGPAQTVQVLHSRLFEGRPTPDNAQLGILFQNGGLANVFASFCVDDGDYYRDSLTLNFENGTIYRNAGPQRCGDELSLVMAQNGDRTIVAHAEVSARSGNYQWENFARAVRGEKLKNATTPAEVVAGLQIIQAMARADAEDGFASIKNLHETAD